MKILDVGPGQIGNELALQAHGRGHTTSFFGRNDPKNTFRQRAEESDVVAITIPSEGGGDDEVFYALESLAAGKPVAIAAKCANAYQSEKIKPHLSQMGITTTAGGPSGMLNLILTPQLGLRKIVTIPNGTLCFMFSRTAEVVPWEQALEEATKEGLTEGGSGLEEVFRGETWDTILKTSGIGNLAGIFREPLIPDEFSTSILSKTEILRLLGAKKFRFIVRMVKQPRSKTYSCFPGFYVRKEGWDIIGEFAEPDQSEFLGNVPCGKQNTLITWNYAGRNQITGDGAGIKATASTLLGELEWLHANRKN